MLGEYPCVNNNSAAIQMHSVTPSATAVLLMNFETIWQRRYMKRAPANRHKLLTNKYSPNVNGKGNCTSSEMLCAAQSNPLNPHIVIGITIFIRLSINHIANTILIDSVNLILFVMVNPLPVLLSTDSIPLYRNSVNCGISKKMNINEIQPILSSSKYKCQPLSGISESCFH